MAKRKKKHGEEEAGEAWLLPYSDLMTLLLAVFIVLFAVSKIDQTKAVEISEAFSENMTSAAAGASSAEGEAEASASPEEIEILPEEVSTPPEPEVVPEEELSTFLGQQELDNLEELKTELNLMFENEGLTYIVTSIDKRGLVISLSNAVLFESGSAAVKDNNKNALIKIAETINKLDNYLRIEGHTDNIPISTSAYPSNWELSTARASSVVRLFITECNVSPEKVVAVGYGEHKPVADNSTQEGRSENRRIDIIVLSEKYNNLEQQIVP